ncbi:MAG: FAD-dependent monooxygenase [Rhodospirillaceae bacterium]|jgi:electron transfer flavoprotein-quinone oxidoreductase|nr:FAD-dependent monooxygenase [Rhodospirillaceae bacterium]
MTEKFDAIVVGAGPAGSAAAYVMAKAGLSVLQLERGEYPGSKNVQGAILYSDALERIIPEFRDEAPLERNIIEQRVWMLTDKSHVGFDFRSEEFNNDKPDRYSIIRAQFDRWFCNKVKQAGAMVICETLVKALIENEHGRVIGVTTDRDDGDVFADIVILADGVNSNLARVSGYRNELENKNTALVVKEMHFLRSDIIQNRFNINEKEGVAIEVVGTLTRGKIGMGFIYTNLEFISIGIGCMVGDFQKGGLTPYGLLDELKEHPSVKPLLISSEMKEYSAHLIPEGGYNAIPKIYGDGWMVVGDSAGLVNSIHREGSNMAMTSGQFAAETVIALKKEFKSFSEHNLARYKIALDNSYVIKDLKKYKRMPNFLHKNRHFFTLYPELISEAIATILRVDGIDKKSKGKQIIRSFRKGRGLFGLIADSIKFVRAIR